MQTIDLVIIFVYLGGILVAGGWFARRQQTTKQYFLAGKNLPWWAIGASIVATETSTVSFISVPGIAYSRGGNFTFLQLVLGYLVGRIVISLLFIPSYFRGQLVTVYELLHRRFGPSIKGIAATLFIVMRTIADGIRLLLTAFVLAAVCKVFFPATTIDLVLWSVVLLGVVMIIFTFYGGIEAVVWIEVVQLLIYVAGAIAAAIVLAQKIPGGFAAAIEIGQQFDKFRMFDFAFDITKTYVFWAGVIGGCFLTMGTHGTDQYMVQRYLCTDRPREASTALLFSGVVVFLQFVGFLLIGVLLFAFYRPDRAADYASGPAAAPFTAGDQIFPDFIVNHLPPGIAGLVVAAIFAAALSSSLSAIASTAIADLYAPLAKGRDDRHLLRMSKLFTVIAGVAQIGVALAMQKQARSALDQALSVASLINGPILGVFLLSNLRRAGTAAALFGMINGLAAVLFLRFATTVAWPWYTVVGSIVTVLAGSIAILIFPGEKEREA